MDQLKELNRNIKELVTNIRFQFEKLAANIGGHINDAMTEEMSVVKETVTDGFDVVKGAGLSVYGFFRKSFNFEKSMFKETKKQSSLQKDTIDAIYDTSSAEYMKQQTKLMQQTVNMSKKDEIRKRGLLGKKGKNMWDYLMDFLGIPFLLAGAAIGAIVGVIVAPFRLIYALFKQFGFFKLLGGILKMVPVVGKFFTWVGELFTTIGNKIMKLPIVGRLMQAFGSGFMKGFTKLFWPLQIILSTIDFIEGYQNTQGDIVDKIKGGIKNAIMKFIELPVTLLEKAWNWLAKELGFEGVESGTFMKKAGEGIDWVFKILPEIWGWFKDIFKWVWGGVKEAFKFAKDRDWDFATIVRDLLHNLLAPIYEWLTEQAKKVLDFFTPNKEVAEAMTQRVNDAERRKVELTGLANAKAVLKEKMPGGRADQLIDTIEKTSKDQEEVLSKIAKLLADMKQGGMNHAMNQFNQTYNTGGGVAGNAPPARPDSERIDMTNRAVGSRGTY